ncbi:hypothetical protein [Tenacibaculum jejuense]|uniref:Uncharacterized protein n=1 Tax=Tenacibaculum jejuense TaxID=584609 RepID=A0A238U8S9_9FLAO|nr:hypothetical protein [Tenacibaculum jejuense]SNR14988.1 protein of unknown function [Tenacibaculum jejuense]
MKLFQLVNPTILGLLVLVCFSFAGGSIDKSITQRFKSLNQTEYYIMHIFPNSNDSSEEIRKCLSERYVFINLIYKPNTIGETWKVKFRLQNTTGVTSNDTEEADFPCFYPYFLSPYTNTNIFSGPPSLSTFN